MKDNYFLENNDYIITKQTSEDRKLLDYRDKESVMVLGLDEKNYSPSRAFRRIIGHVTKQDK